LLKAIKLFKEKKMKNVKSILSLLSAGSSNKIILIVFLIISNSFIEMLGIALIYPIINILLVDNFVDQILRYDFSGLFFNKDKKEIFKILLFLLMFSIFFKFVFQIALTRKIAKFNGFQEANISILLLKKYLQFPYIFFLNKNSSTIINELTQVTGRFVSQILNPMLILFSDGFLLLIASFFLIYIDYKVFIFATSILLLFSFFYISIIKKKIFEWGKNLNDYDGKKINIIQQIFLSLRNFKLSKNQHIFFNSYSDYSIKRVNIIANYRTILDIPKLSLELIVVVLFSTFLIYLNGKNFPSVEIVSYVSVYAVCFIRLMPVVNRVLFNLQELRYGKDSLDKLLAIKNNVNIDQKVITTDQNINFNTVKIENIFFNNVSFGYGSDKLILKNINLKILKGEKIGIIGKTGSGKTTFVDILCGLINPTIGEVLYNQKNIYYNLELYKRSVGYVPQAVFLNDDSIIKNIAFGVEVDQIDHSKINLILEILNLDSLVKSLPDKLNTKVGENGFCLSGGQRQRIGIARSIYHEPNIIIFDEATNSLDSDTEKSIFNNLKNYLKNVTIVMITHNVETLKFCSRVLKVQDGKVFDKTN
jgi:ABC-type multidrug transport system fused ATPase/permease subunit